MNFKTDEEKKGIKVIHVLEQSEIGQITSKLRTALVVSGIIMLLVYFYFLSLCIGSDLKFIIIAFFQVASLGAYYLFRHIQRKGSTKHEEEHKKEGERHGIQGEFKKFTMAGFYLCNNDQYSLVPNFMRMLLAPFKKLYIIDCVYFFALSSLTCVLSSIIGIALSTHVIGSILVFCILFCVLLTEGYIPDISTTIKLRKYREYHAYMERKEDFDLSSTKKFSDTREKTWYVIFENI